MMRTRRTLNPTLSDVIRQALREDRDVRLDTDENGYLAIEIDDVTFSKGHAWETFGYPLKDIPLERGAEDLADELVRGNRRRRYLRRMDRLSTEVHVAVHGDELPTDSTERNSSA